MLNFWTLFSSQNIIAAIVLFILSLFGLGCNGPTSSEELNQRIAFMREVGKLSKEQGWRGSLKWAWDGSSEVYLKQAAGADTGLVLNGDFEFDPNKSAPPAKAETSVGDGMELVNESGDVNE